MSEDDEPYRDLGDLSATPPWFSVGLSCHRCKVRWTGCWDAAACPLCGDAEGFEQINAYGFPAEPSPDEPEKSA